MLSNNLFTKLTLCLIFASFPKLISSKSRDRQQNLLNGARASIVNGYPSSSRAFFVRVRRLAQNEVGIGDFCGGAILENHWVITAARCVFRSHAHELVVDFGDFSTPGSRIIQEAVLRVIVHQNFQNASKPENDLALLKTRHAFDLYKIPLCTTTVNDWTILRTCGLGSISRSGMEFSETLQETDLRDSKYDWSDFFNIRQCHPSLVCTESAPGDSSICFMDEGSPLYKVDCRGLRVQCLYGIASFFRTPNEISPFSCNGASYFTSIVFHGGWIRYVMETY